MFKKIMVVICAATLAISMFAACGTADDSEDTAIETAGIISAETNAAVQTSVEEYAQLEVIEIDYSKADEDSEYDETGAAVIELSDGGTIIDGTGAQADGDVITISQEGEYVLSGTLSDGKIVVDAPEEDVVQLILNGVSINNNSGSALLVFSAEKVVLTLAEGSENFVSDGAEYADVSEEAPDAAIYAGEDLTINGEGSLIVTGNYMHGIKSVDDLVIMSGEVNVTAVADGIRGKDSLIVSDGVITVDAGSDGIKSNNDEDEESGYVVIEGGDITVTSGSAGIQAETTLMIYGGTIDITSGEDSLHCNGNIGVSGGDMMLSSGDDGIHANNALEILNGTITVAESFEGLEGTSVSIAGGEITIKSSDDGINAAGGSDNESDPNDAFNYDSSCFISISGGSVYVTSGDEGVDGDGIDSNGDLFISGGVIVVDGPEDFRNTALDANESGVFEVTGGTIIAVGSSDMLIVPTEATQPVLTVVLSGTQAAGETISVTDSSANTVISASAAKSYESVILSSAEFELGESYTVLIDGDKLFSFDFDENVTTLDNEGNETEIEHFGGGGGGGNMGGQRPGR